MKILSITCLLVLMVALPIISEGKVTLKDNENLENVDKELESNLALELMSRSNDKEDRNKFIDKMFYRVSFEYQKKKSRRFAQYKKKISRRFAHDKKYT